MFRPDPLCGCVGHQRGDEERDRGVVWARRDQGQGDRARPDLGPQPGPRAPVIRKFKRDSQQTAEGNVKCVKLGIIP